MRPGIVATLVLAVALLPGCGGGGDREPAAPGARSERPDPPASGIEPASAKAAAQCLEQAGFDVTAGQSSGGVAELVSFLGEGDVEGTLNYFELEQDAFDAEVAALRAQEPHARVGRIGTALYSFEGEGLDALERTVRACVSG